LADGKLFICIIIFEAMKKKIQVFTAIIVIIALAFAGCGSNHRKKKVMDSILKDTTVLDTTDMKAAPSDTTVMRMDTINKDTVLVAH